MYHKSYTNHFVRPTSPPVNTETNINTLTGYEVRKMYLAEVKDAKANVNSFSDAFSNIQAVQDDTNKNKAHISVCDRELFAAAQSDDLDILKPVFDKSPDKINVLDEYGWSLLMIACQANSLSTVKELLKRGADISIRDKAGNSVQSLIIKNKNLELADLLLRCKYDHTDTVVEKKDNKHKVRLKERFICYSCNNIEFPDRLEHLSSTLHNINASKGKKLPSNFIIPESNRGFQLMLKGGWDKESGLGPDGLGKKYPIKSIQKIDRKGLGHTKKRNCDNIKDTMSLKPNISKTINRNQVYRQMEINFRRQFY